MGEQEKNLKTNKKKLKNIEIEIRLWLKNPEQLAQWLKNTATLLSVSEQTDFYFDPPDKSFIFMNPQGLRDADEWLRIRTSDRENSICYKKWHRNKDTGASLYADEIEVPITDISELLNILKRLGFKKTAVVKKRRESWEYGNFEFDCDSVQKLGYFIEVEYKGEVSNPKNDKERIFLLLKDIGLKDWKIIDRGYPWMLWNPKRW